MGKIILFHGTPDKIVVPTYGKEKHDYGRGFYLELLCEFIVSGGYDIPMPEDESLDILGL